MNFYLNNVRGFTNMEIPILQINFLVGENSTGKTSLMGLFHIISSHSFWFAGDFSSKEFNFGKFSDLISKKSTLRTFQLGLSLNKNDLSRHSNNDLIFYAVCKFEEHEGLARVKGYSICDGSLLTHIFIDNKKMKYVTQESVYLNENKPLTDLARIQDSVNYNGPSFNEYDLPGKVPLAFLIEIARRKDDNDILTLKSLFNIVTDINETIWHSPIRVKPRRTYDDTSYEYNSEGLHTPYLIRKILKSTKADNSIKNALLNYGKNGGLFDSLSIKEYGNDSTAPFELDVGFGRHKFPINQVGYGVSQVLPVVVELLFRKNNDYYLIQQPEIHLHPKAQAALGSFFYDMASISNRKAFIETHSDYIIDRFRLSLSKNQNNSVSSQVLFFEKNNGDNRISIIPIMKNGEFSPSQPKTFRSFFLNEELELLRIR